jgi:hypothetical protein
MRTLGIKAKIWLSLATFAAGYLALLGLLRWTASQTPAHMRVASGSLFPAALSSVDSQSAFATLRRRYQEAVLLQDKTDLASADQDARHVLASLQSVKEKTATDPELQRSCSQLIEKFSDINTRSTTMHSSMADGSKISERM